MVESLVEIDISGCSNLMGAIVELEKMKSLQVLKASRMDTDRLLTVEVVSQASIWPWVPKPRVQMSLASLPCSLVHLNLSECNLTDDAFPRDLSSLSKLQHLFLCENQFSSLPNFIKDLTGLQTLDLSGCQKLRQIRWSSTILQDLFVIECGALEGITYETASHIKNITSPLCPNLYHVQGHFKFFPVKEVDVELINSIGFFNLDSMADAAEAQIVNFPLGFYLRPIPIQRAMKWKFRSALLKVEKLKSVESTFCISKKRDKYPNT
ncbi:hypothetical protein RHMOL_Rhmol11G0209300 [Rhododendron molle]|uniref:Uncharacterized protein n=1 Tax=Rhododendron molle TaxID=49168 RepID=A0ACC0LV33_RHOML|nr:hypothetical protein RHMOL_Rhmol11G0209300 [Rhododendron molle]